MSTADATFPIRARALSKTYRLGFWRAKRVQALESLDLEVAAGQVYGLLGPNGAGKSTTIKILMNLVRPTTGEAWLFGQRPSSGEARRQVGFLPENPAPYEYLTGREFVTLEGALGGLSGKELDDRVKAVLGSVGMERTAGLQIRKYSKGMVQRIALAQALVNRPKLLVLDEPTSGLDPVGRRQMRDLILEQRALGTTVLLCSHIIPDVESVCDRVAVLVGGRRVREGSVRDLLSSQVPLVELVVEGVSPDLLRPSEVREVAGRLLVKASDSEVPGLLRKVLDGGGRVVELSPSKFSLEELFLKALDEAGRPTVGGEIS